MNDQRAVPPSRPPVKQTAFLLPIWGKKYIGQFLNVALRTWLSDGNIPAVAGQVKSEFVFLTNANGETALRRHPVVQQLEKVLPVRYVGIDDLITGSNHSTTITLAYEQAVRESGAAALDTCFFFLVSDFIFADGSLRNAFARMHQGNDVVLAGNFQVVAEDAAPWLQAQTTGAFQPLALAPREAMRWGLLHLHPVAIANTVDFASLHNEHSNRLFWRVGPDTLLGRFYLLHMLCIRPSRLDFEITSSCDYSFVPELSPDGRIAVMDDSDTYLVIEMQPRRHEGEGLRTGPRVIGEFAKTLSEWTTAQHRLNAQTSIVFHAGDRPPDLPAAEANATAYTSEVAKLLSPEPISHRDHPYWRGAIAALKEGRGMTLDPFEWKMVLGLINPLADRGAAGENLKDWILDRLGRPPNVHRLHPRWIEYNAVSSALDAAGPDAKRLLLSDTPTAMTATVVPRPNTVRIRTPVLLSTATAKLEHLYGNVDVCLIEVDGDGLDNVGSVVRKVGPMMRPHGRVIISYMVRGAPVPESVYGIPIALFEATVLWRAADGLQVIYVPTSRARYVALQRLRQLGRFARRHPLASIPLVGIAGPMLVALAWLTSWSLAASKEPPRHGVVSGFLLMIDADAAREVWPAVPEGESELPDDSTQFDLAELKPTGVIT